ncbi:hypothetical protein DSM104443_00459 [Usitatibacter rugosus]|uniref:MORN repeat protein n=1 Tax=Usitatibacter rugosus TaxID=2732067 RepID=A0A6M4GQT8_9PROT|nr:hypothetical protein [Usitatibacter rugosus]QJR09415.1 hypothetical protein DSM104443_00459 [Usitatibacter rugosus]
MNLPVAFLLFFAALLAPLPARAQADTAFAREVQGSVEKQLGDMASVTFTTRLPKVEYRSEVRAWSDGQGVRKIATVDRDDSGDVVTEYYFAKGALVFAYQAIKGFNAAGKSVTRIEQRQYFQGGRMVRWLGGLEKADLAKDPGFAREGKARLAAAAFLQDGAKLLEGKRGSGTLLKTENGDVACYLHLRDAGGTEFMELGDFDLCFQKPSPIGRLVRLEYGVDNVLADECQGNPDCGKSERVALVTRVQPAALCTSAEAVVFACRAGAKLVSVCASKNASATSGYLEYRFGKAEVPPELVLPSVRTVPSRAATGESVAFSGGGGSWLRFRKGEHAYVAYGGIGKWGPQGETREKQGVVVERGGKAISHVKCGELIQTLGPDDYARLGITAKGEDFHFPD